MPGAILSAIPVAIPTPLLLISLSMRYLCCNKRPDICNIVTKYSG